MNTDLRLLLVLAHPDDETLGNGGTVARYAAEGVAVHLVTATAGEEGWFGAPDEHPGSQELGRIRRAELEAAAEVLGIRDVTHLGYHDGKLADVPRPELAARIASQIRRTRPQVVITFDQYGVYGHPDHIAICSATTAAVSLAGSAAFADTCEPCDVAKLYYMALSSDEMATYEEAFGDLVMTVDGEERRSVAWPDWAITTHIDAVDHWRQVWQAVTCHRTQLPQYERLTALPEAHHQRMWGGHSYCRVLTRVDCGSGREDDLFAGLR